MCVYTYETHREREREKQNDKYNINQSVIRIKSHKFINFIDYKQKPTCGKMMLITSDIFFFYFKKIKTHCQSKIKAKQVVCN